MTTDLIDTTLRSLPSSRELRYENYQVVSVVQALWGSITPNMVAISLKCSGPEVHLRFYLEDDSPVDRGLIDDVRSDVETLQFTAIPIHAHVDVAGAEVQLNQIQGRLLYWRYRASVPGAEA